MLENDVVELFKIVAVIEEEDEDVEVSDDDEELGDDDELGGADELLLLEELEVLVVKMLDVVARVAR